MAVVVRDEPKDYPCGSCQCGPEGRDPDGGTWTIAGVLERSPICPRRLISPLSRHFLDLHRHYRRGFLPVSGGLLDQPYAFLRAMTVIEEWSNDRRHS